MTDNSSLYTQAAMMGVSMALDSETAETRAVYNETFRRSIERYKAAQVADAAMANIARIKSDKLMSNVGIQMMQQQAEAQIKLNAAVAGVEGGSVDDALVNAGRNAARRGASISRGSEMEIENLATQVGSTSFSTNLPDVEIPGFTERAIAALTTDLGGTIGELVDYYDYKDEDEGGKDSNNATLLGYEGVQIS